MIRATFDTNVIASGVLGYERDASAPGRILRRWLDGAFALITSDHLIAETKRTLANAYFVERVRSEVRLLTETALAQRAVRTDITAVVGGVASHPEDDLILATAVSAGADYLVTGDRQLLKLSAYEGVEIVSPRDFLSILERQSHDPT